MRACFARLGGLGIDQEITFNFIFVLIEYPFVIACQRLDDMRS